MTTEAELRTSPEIGGMGHSVKRKEDPRFIRGKGEYIEDVNLPGQLWLDIVRSPYAHATIKSIDPSEALKIPGVAAVVTGKDLEGYSFHWMPTLAGDMQMVLPVDTVMYQSQEVAAVIATSRYAAADGVAAVLVDYEPLPVVIDPHKALEPDAFVLRPDRGPEKANNHIWHWESGDRAAADAALASAEVTVSQDIYIPRIHVASIETCGCVADWDPVRQQLTLHMTSQAPHAIRTVLALVAGGAGLPIYEHNIRVKTHDIGGGFGGKVPVYPGYVLAVAASFLTASRSSGSRTGARTSRPTRSPAITTSTPRWARQRKARSPASRSRRSPTTAIPTPRPTRRSSRPACSTSSPAPTTSPTRSSRSTASTPTSRPEALPIAARSG